MDIRPHDIRSKFRELFNKEPLVVRAPGRINLIGEHTDYNDGFVMPAAIDREIFFGVGASGDGRCVIYSIDYDERFEFDLQEISPVDTPRWANYLLGILHQFQLHGLSVAPLNCVFGGNVPLGAGMSSSAALECGFALAVSELNALDVPRLKIITMAQWAEHHYAGVKCGIMDQFASVMGKRGNVIILDCRSLEHQYASLNTEDYGIVLCDTKVKHSLVDSEYNLRRRECESGVARLKTHYPDVQSLRDVSIEMVEVHKSEFEGKVYQRCLYVVQEISRVQEAREDLRRRDLISFGKKMFDTHEGLSALYEVSCRELDFLVNDARRFPGVIGARMMGGGFGGCTINLVQKREIEGFIVQMTSSYRAAFDIDMPVYQVNIADGVGIVA